MKYKESFYKWKDINQAIKLYSKYKATKKKQKAMSYLKMAGKYL